MFVVDKTLCWAVCFVASRRRHTRCLSDWSSDVCSCDRALRSALIQAAWAATRAEGSPFAARYRRLRHRGHKKAVVAVAHALLRVIYHMLASGTHYRDVGADYFDRRHIERAARRAIRVLEGQGYRVLLQPAA